MVFSNLFPPQDGALPRHRVGQHLLIARRVVITVLSPGDSRLRLRGYVADAQPCRCCPAPQLAAQRGGGVEPGEQQALADFFWERHRSKMVRGTRLRRRLE